MVRRTIQYMTPSRELLHQLADTAQNAAVRSAERLEAAEAPMKVLADATSQLSAVSHRYVGRMLDQSVLSAEGWLAEGAQCLRLAARAPDVRRLYREQLGRLPHSYDRATQDVRATWKILADAGRELQTLALNTYSRLRGEQREPTRSAKSGRPRSSKAKKKSRARRST
jgi:hypothetical protein